MDSILEVRSHRMRSVWKDMEPQLDAIADSARADIMGVLTEEQRAEYDRIRQEWRDRRNNDRNENDDDQARGDDRDGRRGRDDGHQQDEHRG